LTLRPEDRAAPLSAFGKPVDAVWLEIGFGAGEHLAWQAANNPRVGIIGCEPYVAGVAKLLAKIARAGPSNIRIHMGDARDVIEALPAASLSRVFVLFPDPWPKARHHKRRIVQMETLDGLARAMIPGAELRFATDDRGYLAYALERLTAHSALRWAAVCAADWRARPADWPETRYEAKALAAGRRPAYLRFIRR